MATTTTVALAVTPGARFASMGSSETRTRAMGRRAAAVTATRRARGGHAREREASAGERER